MFYGIGAVSMTIGIYGLYKSINYYINEYKVAKQRRKDAWINWWSQIKIGMQTTGIIGLILSSMYCGHLLKQSITKKLA